MTLRNMFDDLNLETTQLLVKARLQDLVTRLGEVSANPTANTLLERTQAIKTSIDSMNTVSTSLLTQIRDYVDTVEQKLQLILNGPLLIGTVQNVVHVDDNNSSLTVDGTIAISNLPSNQPVTVTNFPSVQPVSISSIPEVEVKNDVGNPLFVSGSFTTTLTPAPPSDILYGSNMAVAQGITASLVSFNTPTSTGPWKLQKIMISSGRLCQFDLLVGGILKASILTCGDNPSTEIDFGDSFLMEQNQIYEVQVTNLSDQASAAVFCSVIKEKFT